MLIKVKDIQIAKESDEGRRRGRERVVGTAKRVDNETVLSFGISPKFKPYEPGVYNTEEDTPDVHFQGLDTKTMEELGVVIDTSAIAAAYFIAKATWEAEKQEKRAKEAASYYDDHQLVHISKQCPEWKINITREQYIENAKGSCGGGFISLRRNEVGSTYHIELVPKTGQFALTKSGQTKEIKRSKYWDRVVAAHKADVAASKRQAENEEESKIKREEQRRVLSEAVGEKIEIIKEYIPSRGNGRHNQGYYVDRYQLLIQDHENDWERKDVRFCVEHAGAFLELKSLKNIKVTPDQLKRISAILREEL
jgi:hypothetical protein